MRTGSVELAQPRGAAAAAGGGDEQHVSVRRDAQRGAEGAVVVVHTHVLQTQWVSRGQMGARHM